MSTLHRGGEGQNAQRVKFSNTYGQGCSLIAVQSVCNSSDCVLPSKNNNAGRRQSRTSLSKRFNYEYNSSARVMYDAAYRFQIYLD